MATPIETFRRTMRRLEKRARKMGLRAAADLFQVMRVNSLNVDLTKKEVAIRGYAALLRSPRLRGATAWDRCRASAFLREHTADAVARLREATRAHVPDVAPAAGQVAVLAEPVTVDGRES